MVMKMEKAKSKLEKKESKVKDAINTRKEIQEEMRGALMAASIELRDPGYISFTSFY